MKFDNFYLEDFWSCIYLNIFINILTLVLVIDSRSTIFDRTSHDGNGLFPIHQWQMLLPSV